MTAEGDVGYYCDSLKVNGKELTAATDGTYSFVAEENACVVNATFAEISDEELFYSNKKTTSAYDPFVLDNTEQDGYYYMYSTGQTTTGAIKCYRSTNLMDWTDMGYVINKTVSEEVGKTLNESVWAPEVVYDDESETYYMFFSATPEKIGNALDDLFQNNAIYVMMVATSKSPDKDFVLVDFSNIHTYDTGTYSQYYAKYSYFDPAILKDKCNDNKTYLYGRAGYIPSIDPHPYVDDNGEKYLFWVDQENDDRICAIQMLNKNWLTPDWSTFTVVTRAGYKAVNGTETVSYDRKGGNNDYYVNEAPEVIKHDGKYYLTYSTGAFAKDTYQVIQAVADSPMGPYRKLTEKEGAILLSSSKAGNTKVTGTGHHSFVTAGDKLYMVYHRHNTPYIEGDDKTGGGSRNHAIDEVKWITNSNGLPVMYVNGPTSTLQPRLDAFSTYKNIADDATVSATGTMNFVHEYDGTTASLSSTDVVFANAATDIDISLDTKRHTQVTSSSEKYDVLFEFENGKNVSFYLGVLKGSWSISNLNSAVDKENEGKIIYGRNAEVWHVLSEAEDSAFKNNTLNFRIVRQGTVVKILLDNDLVATVDLTYNNSGVKAGTTAKVTVRHYGTPDPSKTTGDVIGDIPYEVSKSSQIDYLTDGYLSVSRDTVSDVVNKVGEATIVGETTFTFNFDSAREVRGIMVYNSKNRKNIFTNISEIELVYEQNGVDVTRTIEDVAFGSEYYTEDYVTLGAAAHIKFAHMNVKSIKITIEVPDGQEAVGISEVRILGK